jgi:hypothetical protein
MEVKLPDLTIDDFLKLLSQKEVLILQLHKLVEQLMKEKESCTSIMEE